ncbi:hypothetical protein, partial [Lactococcus garvieae]
KTYCNSNFEKSVLKKIIPILFFFFFLIKYDPTKKNIFLVTRKRKNWDYKQLCNIIKHNKTENNFIMFQNLSFAITEDGFYGYSIIILNPVNNGRALYIVKDGKIEYVED